MLKYEKVPERSKNRLKLKDIGYQGFITCLSDIPSSMLLFRCLSEQVLGAGTAHPAKTRLALATHPECVPWGPHWSLPTRFSRSWGCGDLWWLLGPEGPVPPPCSLSLSTDPPNYKDLVAVVYLSHRADLTVRLDICRKVSGGMGTRGCDQAVTLGLSSPEPPPGTRPCPNAGAMGMVGTPHAQGCQQVDMPVWRWCNPSTP